MDIWGDGRATSSAAGGRLQHFFKHINDNLHKDMKINSLQLFYHPKCPPRPNFRLATAKTPPVFDHLP